MTEATRAPDGSPLRRVIFSGLLGNTIEYYDFLLYGTVSALVFNRLFFTNLSPAVATFASFTTFAVGYLARPVGGLVFGHLGDRYGRKPMLLTSMIVMGVASTLIGVLPTYGTAGNWAPVLLVFLRLCQGIAVGGEWGGSTLLAAEHAPPARRGLLVGVVQLGGPLGSVLSTAVLALVSLMPEDGFLTWGWRIPFLFSAALLVLGLFVRLKVVESEVFLRSRAADDRQRAPLIELVRRPGQLLRASFFIFGATVTQALTSAFMVSYATGVGIGRSDILLGQVFNGVGAGIAMLVATALSDRIGRRHTLIGAALLLAAVAYPVFAMIGTGDPVLLWIALGLLAAPPMGALLAPSAALLAESFDTGVRYTGVSVGYQFAAVLGGGLAPLIGVSLLSLGGGNPVLVAAYMAAACLASAVAVWSAKETRGRDLVAPVAAAPETVLTSQS
ncbi:MHS family MFS transporter [Amycolatopsis sp. NBC_00355]|uniref:MFS transporter n=1 Tax=Amycolatopsis sp. NBC_00355 TaxID=2975957 RepID=UPI002E26B7AD